MNVTDYISKGQGNAISAQKLAGLCGYSSARQLQKAIQVLRRETVILSSNEGYFLPGNDAEVCDFIKTLESRARGTFAALRTARRYLRRVPGQTILEE